MNRSANKPQPALRLVSSDDHRTVPTDRIPRLTNAASRAAVGGNDLAAGAAVVYAEMFHGLRARLQTTAAACPITTAADTNHATLRIVREGILDCATALEHVHARLTPDIGRLQRIERELHDARTGMARVQAELTRVRASEIEAQHLATHDALTALPNRRLFRQRLIQTLSRSSATRRALAVFYIDLDRFKSVNDEHGHDTGDELLRIIAARLVHGVRADDSVGRLGGDEFAYVLTGLRDRSRIRRTAEMLFAALAAPIKIGSLEIVMEPSIGIAMSPDDGVTAEELLRSADAAMYRAKRHRTGHAFFSG